jgi:hypothetical protein
MSFVRKFALASIALATVLGAAGHAQATRLFKGVIVVTARTDTVACRLQYDVSQSFVAIYDANIGTEARPERLAVVTNNGSLLLTNSDTTPTLRGTGRVLITGNYLTLPINITNSMTNFAISAVTPTTTVVSIQGAVSNAGIPGCSVSIRGALTFLPPGGF